MIKGPARSHSQPTVTPHKITDRTCAKISGVEPQSFTPKDPTDGSFAHAKRTRLADDVLKSVEQELLKFVLPKVSA